MIKEKTITNIPAWVPLDKRKGMPPRKPELRRPLFWLMREGNELFFVNSSCEAIDSLVASSGGFVSDDDGAATVSTPDYEYANIAVNEAVKVDEYDNYYDLDYVIQVVLKLSHPKLGSLEIYSPSEKGCLDETILLWDTGESGKHVSIK